MNIKLPASATRFVAKNVFLLKQNSPSILLATGLAGGVVATVMACKATLKLDAVTQAAENKILTIQEIDEPGYTESDRSKALARVRIDTIAKTVRLYSPAVAVGMVSAGCLIGGQRILSTRNAALVGAYASLERAFNNYRDRVIEELGPDREREIRFGTEVEHVVQEDGKVATKLKLNGDRSPYAVFFDEVNSRAWSRSSYDNQVFLKMQQQYLNDMLKAQGFMFLNDVYKSLGLPLTKAGQIVGWVDGYGDSYIDFGIFDGDLFSAMRFVNGDERSVLLDFNVDGPILDLLEQVEADRKAGRGGR